MEKCRVDNHNAPYKKPLAMACYLNNGEIVARPIYTQNEINRLLKSELHDIGNKPCIIIYRDNLDVDHIF